MSSVRAGFRAVCTSAILVVCVAATAGAEIPNGNLYYQSLAVPDDYSSPALWQSDPTNAATEIVGNGLAGSTASGATTSPDGSRIVYTRKSTSDVFYELYTANRDGSQEQLLKQFAGGDVNETAFPQWEPDGNRTLFYQWSQRSAEVVNEDGSLTMVPNSWCMSNYVPRWVPGSKDHVLVCNRDDLYTMKIDGSDRKAITKDGLLAQSRAQGVYIAPAFSPDGKRIVLPLVEAGTKSFWSDLYTIDLDAAGNPVDSDGDGATVDLFYSEIGDQGFPAFSPDGKWIAFGYEGKADVYKINSVGDKSTLSLAGLGSHGYNSTAGKYVFWAPAIVASASESEASAAVEGQSTDSGSSSSEAVAESTVATTASLPTELSSRPSICWKGYKERGVKLAMKEGLVKVGKHGRRAKRTTVSVRVCAQEASGSTAFSGQTAKISASGTLTVKVSGKKRKFSLSSVTKNVSIGGYKMFTFTLPTKAHLAARAAHSKAKAAGVSANNVVKFKIDATGTIVSDGLPTNSLAKSKYVVPSKSGKKR